MTLPMKRGTTRARSLQMLACAALLAALAGCSGAEQRSAKAQAQALASAAPRIVHEDLVGTVVRAKLAQVDPESVASVHVTVRHGLVTLRGKARTAHERRRFVVAAQSVSGVTRVADELQIDSHLPDPKRRVADLALAARVSAAIAGQAGTNVLSVKPSVNDGVVTLEGKVPTQAVNHTVAATTAKVSGVTRVIDHLRVGS